MGHVFIAESEVGILVGTPLFAPAPWGIAMITLVIVYCFISRSKGEKVECREVKLTQTSLQTRKRTDLHASPPIANSENKHAALFHPFKRRICLLRVQTRKLQTEMLLKPVKTLFSEHDRDM